MNNPVVRINASQADSLPGMLEFQWTEAGKGLVRGQYEVATKHFSPHGLLHGAAIVALADSACGFVASPRCRRAQPASPPAS
jgi:acyl-coenzyme A thioesterase PaaI-like protein